LYLRPFAQWLANCPCTRHGNSQIALRNLPGDPRQPRPPGFYDRLDASANPAGSQDSCHVYRHCRLSPRFESSVEQRRRRRGDAVPVTGEQRHAAEALASPVHSADDRSIAPVADSPPTRAPQRSRSNVDGGEPAAMGRSSSERRPAVEWTRLGRRYGIGKERWCRPGRRGQIRTWEWRWNSRIPTWKADGPTAHLSNRSRILRRSAPRKDQRHGNFGCGCRHRRPYRQCPHRQISRDGT